jgi:hypothetical protein
LIREAVDVLPEHFEARFEKRFRAALARCGTQPA